MAAVLDGARREHRRRVLPRQLLVDLRARDRRPATVAPQLSELVDDPCLILLGEPGLGKSFAIADAVAELRHAGHAVHLVDLGAYDEGASLVGAIVESPTWREWRESEDVLYLFLDGLDEAQLQDKAIHKRIIAEFKAPRPTTAGSPTSGPSRLRSPARTAARRPRLAAAAVAVRR
jgi:hypothetical protein